MSSIKCKAQYYSLRMSPYIDKYVLKLKVKIKFFQVSTNELIYSKLGCQATS